VKIAVYTIAKNEAARIERWAESCEDADVRLVLDTGSTDDTTALARDAGCMVRLAAIKPWRFDNARNRALDLLPEDVDWCITLDADEVLAPGWRDAIEQAPADATRLRYRYVWSWGPDGAPGIEFMGDRTHRRHGWTWEYPCHEHLRAEGPDIVADAGFEIHHHPDDSKPRSGYLPLLGIGAREYPTSDRMAFYYGRELYYAGQWQQSRLELWRFLHMPTAVWAPERAHALRLLGDMDDNPERWYLRGCAEAPDRREPWVALAEHYLRVGQHGQAAASAGRALAIEQKPMDYLCEPWAWNGRPQEIIEMLTTDEHRRLAGNGNGKD
jgi:glycosyltransferase involved in cell wall biosynthesis